MDVNKVESLVAALELAYREREHFEISLSNREVLAAIAQILEDRKGYRITWHSERVQIHVDKSPVGK